ncbi:hypothetical protein EUX98_g8572 [Antrodiella citrinella]|uniref:HNH nuclease domain-containing protein n=1 Tax=Antrodiella citrinella TaxID=2447956 RepID=A0A4S4M614_9APHY|nr:hypothetical protein EUX98_g8572 [Antrodiella citrinella]
MGKLDIAKVNNFIVCNAKSFVEHLQHNEDLNTFVPPGSESEVDATLHIRLDRVLLAMLEAKEDHPGSEGTDSEVRRNTTLSEYLRAVAITWLTQFLFVFKAVPIGSEQDQTHPSGLGVASILKVAPLIKRAAAVFTNNPTNDSFNPTDILRCYTQIPNEFIEKINENIHRPSNLMMLLNVVHEQFDTYDISLAKTDVDHEYKIVYFDHPTVKRILSRQFEGG